MREKFKFCCSSILSKIYSSRPQLRLFRCHEEESAIDLIIAFGVAPLSLVEVILSTDPLPVDQLPCKPVELSCHQLFLV